MCYCLTQRVRTATLSTWNAISLAPNGELSRYGGGIGSGGVLGEESGGGRHGGSAGEYTRLVLSAVDTPRQFKLVGGHAQVVWA